MLDIALSASDTAILSPTSYCSSSPTLESDCSQAHSVPSSQATPQSPEHNSALQTAAGAIFPVRLDQHQCWVAVREVEPHISNAMAIRLIDTIRKTLSVQHDLSVDAVVLVTIGSLPRASGKVQMQICRTQFLEGRLRIVQDWSNDTRLKAEFQNLSAEVNWLKKQLEQPKRVGDR